MRLDFECFVTPYAATGLDRPLTAPQCRAYGLDGMEIPSLEMACWFESPSIADEGLHDVGIRLWIDADGDLRATISFRCVAKLDMRQVQALSAELEGQLVDGAGEDHVIETQSGAVRLEWLRRGTKYLPEYSVRQFDDGVAAPDLRPPASLRAAECGDLAALRAALEAGCAVNARGRWGMTALMLAAREGHARCVAFLLEHRAEVNIATETSTALVLSCMSGHQAIVEHLLAAGADHGAGVSPPLYWAANRGHAEICRTLLSAGANPNQPGEGGQTALFMTDSTEIVQLLLKAGADPSIKDQKGETALENAVRQAEFLDDPQWGEPERAMAWRAVAAKLRDWPTPQ